jgi:hypothetical protein
MTDPGSFSQDWKPRPDPTARTTEDLIRALGAERDYTNGKLEVIGERFRGIDRATELLNEQVNRTPTEIQKQIAHLREVFDTKFSGYDAQISLRDESTKREKADAALALRAAFDAQKESAAEQNKSNTLAIDKAAQGQKETVSNLEQVVSALNKTLTDKVDDLKTSLAEVRTEIAQIRYLKLGAGEQRAETSNAAAVSRDSQRTVIALLGLVLTVVLFAFGYIVTH